MEEKARSALYLLMILIIIWAFNAKIHNLPTIHDWVKYQFNLL